MTCGLRFTFRSREDLRLSQLLSSLHPHQSFINGCSNEAVDVRLKLSNGIELAVQYGYLVANKFHLVCPFPLRYLRLYSQLIVPLLASVTSVAAATLAQ